MDSFSYLMHHGVKGQKWGVRRYQNKDGSYKRNGSIKRKLKRKINKIKKDREQKRIKKLKEQASRGEWFSFDSLNRMSNRRRQGRAAGWFLGQAFVAFATTVQPDLNLTDYQINNFIAKAEKFCDKVGTDYAIFEISQGYNARRKLSGL